VLETLVISSILQAGQSAYQSKRARDVRKRQEAEAQKRADEAARQAKLAEQVRQSKEAETEAKTLETAAEESVPLSVKRKLRIGSGTGVNY
jgi:low affinity Fe/Cu permease